MWAELYFISHLVITAACAWAVMSPRVNDGVVGKLVLILLSFASLSCAAWAWLYPHDVSRYSALFALAVAGMAVRCYWLKTWAPSVRRSIKRRIRKCN